MKTCYGVENSRARSTIRSTEAANPLLAIFVLCVSLGMCGCMAVGGSPQDPGPGTSPGVKIVNVTIWGPCL